MILKIPQTVRNDKSEYIRVSFEEICAHISLPVWVGGTEHTEWVNAVHKPPAILDLLDGKQSDLQQGGQIDS